MATWVAVAAAGRRLSLVLERAAHQEAATLAGCDVITTDLRPAQMPKEMLHARSKDVALVAWAFRPCKTTHLEIRPISVPVAQRTRAHALVGMLASHLIQALRARWQPLHTTVEEGITELSQFCSTAGHIPGQMPSQVLPVPRDFSAQLLEAAEVRLPRLLPAKGIIVATKKQRQHTRKTL